MHVFVIFQSGNSQALSAANPASPASSSITVSPHSVPFYRQTYPPNFFPYGQYISPVYMPPMHQFLCHNGFHAQPSTGNIFLPPAAAAAVGVKYSLPQFKPGTNAGNLSHIGLQSGSSFITAPVGYGPASTVTSGSSMGNEDNVASQQKESQIYSTGQRVGFTRLLDNSTWLFEFFWALLVTNLSFFLSFLFLVMFRAVLLYFVD